MWLTLQQRSIEEEKKSMHTSYQVIEQEKKEDETNDHLCME